MGAATISFFASAIVAIGAALLAVLARDQRRALAALAVVLLAAIVPLIQLRASIVAGVLLATGAIVIALLGALSGLGVNAEQRTRAPAFWGLAGAGLLGSGWVLLATGSRQVVELPPQLSEGAAFGRGELTLQLLVGEHLVSSSLVGLLALCCVIAAVLIPVAEDR